MQALTEGVEYRLNFDQQAGTWWVTKADDAGQEFTNVTDDIGRQFTVPEGISIQNIVFQSDLQSSPQGSYISFRAGGKTDPAVITLGSDTNTVQVACVSPLGSFRIVKGATQ